MIKNARQKSKASARAEEHDAGTACTASGRDAGIRQPDGARRQIPRPAPGCVAGAGAGHDGGAVGSEGVREGGERNDDLPTLWKGRQKRKLLPNVW